MRPGRVQGSREHLANGSSKHRESSSEAAAILISPGFGAQQEKGEQHGGDAPGALLGLEEEVGANEGDGALENLSDD
jgi:hypothetical protein